MNERLFYDDKNQFCGSMDEDGIVYDNFHRIIGHVSDDTIYDNTNIPRGYIGQSGEVQNLNHLPIGREIGGYFEGWSGNPHGHVMEGMDIKSHGSDFGIFSLIKGKKKQVDSSSQDDKHYDAYYEDDDYDDDYSWCDRRPKPRPKPRRRQTEPVHSDEISDAIGYGCGCLVVGFILLVCFAALGSAT